MAQTCITCGNEIEQVQGKKGGRPKDYCTRECREIENFWIVFEKKISEKDLTKEKKMQWRSRLMQVGNWL